MLSKKNRVTKELFQLLMKEGKVLNGSFFLFRYINKGFLEVLPSQIGKKSYSAPCFVFVAPKSVAKSSVVRNSLRRKGYRALSPSMPNKGFGIFFFKKQALTANSVEIIQDISILLKKANLYD